MTTISGNNHTYVGTEIVGALGNQILRTITANSTDVFPTTADLIAEEFGSPAADFIGCSMTVGITNSSGSFNITQNLGTGQTLEPSLAGNYTTTIVTPGATYTSATGVATTGGTGSGLTVNTTDTAGAITAIVINNPGSGYTVGDTLTITGGDGNATFTLTTIFDTILGGQTRVYEFVITSATAMDVFVRSSGNNSEVTGIALSSGEVLVGQTNGQALGVTMSGNVTISDSGVTTIGANQVTNAMLVNDDITIATNDGIVGDTAVLGGTLTISVDNTVIRTTGAQSMAGPKTFTDTTVFETGLSLEETGAGTDTITLQAPASIAASYTLTLPVDDGLPNQFLQTDGSGVLTWASTASVFNYLSMYGPTADVTVTGTLQNVVFSTIFVNSGYTTPLTSVVIPTTGVYQISYWCQFATVDTTGGVNSSLQGTLAIGGTPVTGTASFCAIVEINSNTNRPGCGKTVLLSLTAADVLSVQFNRPVGTTTAVLTASNTTLAIEQIA